MTHPAIPPVAPLVPKPSRLWPRSARLFGVLGALSACLSVIFSAALAHGPVFAGGVPVMVQTALSQQQFHSLGLLITGLALGVNGTSRWILSAGWLMLVGLVLFSFNLYARYVWGFDGLRAWVPWGGGAWILAWLALAVGWMRGSDRGDGGPHSTDLA